jgi:CubicO group peptidase (beta-lactamase class C family)
MPARTPLVACLLAAQVAGQAQAQAPRAFASRWAPVATEFRALLGREGIVGGSLWFLKGDSVLAREFHGFADQATGRKVDAHTIFHWASITKTLTAIGIMQLRDRGQLQLDDPIVKYVPELMAVHNAHGPMESLTIRHLLSHSAGFRNPTWPWGGDKPGTLRAYPVVPARRYAAVLRDPLSPGSKYSYSNPG